MAEIVTLHGFNFKMTCVLLLLMKQDKPIWVLLVIGLDYFLSLYSLLSYFILVESAAHNKDKSEKAIISQLLSQSTFWSLTELLKIGFDISDVKFIVCLVSMSLHQLY